MPVYADSPLNIRIITPSGRNGMLFDPVIAYPYPYEHELGWVEQLAADASGGLASRRAPRVLGNYFGSTGNLGEYWTPINADEASPFTNYGSTNLIANPGFEDGTVGPWAADSSVFNADTLSVVDGYPNRLERRNVARVVHNEGEYTGLRMPAAIPVTAGVDYSLSGYVQTDAPDRQVTCYIQWWDDPVAGAVIDAPNASVVSTYAPWTRVSMDNVSAPAGAEGARPYFRVFSPATGASTYYDALSFRATNGNALGPDPITWTPPGPQDYFKVYAADEFTQGDVSGDVYLSPADGYTKYWGVAGSLYAIDDTTIGQPWNLSFYAKTTESAPMRVWPRIEVYANGVTTDVLGAPLVQPANTWTRHSLTFTIEDEWPGAYRGFGLQMLMGRVDNTEPNPNTAAWFSSPQLTYGATLHPAFLGGMQV